MMFFVLTLLSLANAAMDWPNTCDTCVWEVTDAFVLQLKSGAPCNCGKTNGKVSLEIEWKTDMDPALAYTSIADNAFNGVTAGRLIMNNMKYSNFYRPGGGLTAITANTFNGLILDGWKYGGGDLYLQGHQITSIPAGFLDNTQMVEGYLYMDNNQIDTIDENAFYPGPAGLEVMRLRKNKIPNVDFKIPLVVHQVDVSDNTVAGPLNTALFKGTGAALTELDLGGNPIGAMAAPAFDHLVLLEDLSVADAGLKDIPADLFNNNGALTDLELDDNEISVLTKEMFASLKDTLEVIEMRRNGIAELPAGMFAEFPNLRVLDFEYNKLKTVPVDLIHPGLTSMSYFFLGNNEITELPLGLIPPGLDTIDEFGVENNKLSYLPPGFFPDGLDCDYMMMEGNYWTGECLAEAVGPAYEIEYLELENNPFMFCRPDWQVEDESDVYIDSSDPGYDSLPLCGPCGPCAGVCDAEHMPTKFQTPLNCKKGKCDANDQNCCTPLPKCECKNKWFHSHCGEDKKMKRCPKKACFHETNGDENEDPWCAVKNFPCHGGFHFPRSDIPYSESDRLADDTTPWMYCGASGGKCEKECCVHGAKSKGKILKINGYKKVTVADINACYNMCQQHEKCAVWEYKYSSRTCKLRRRTSKKNDAGRNSGELWKEQDPRTVGSDPAVLHFGQRKGSNRPATRKEMDTVVGAKDCNPTA